MGKSKEAKKPAETGPKGGDGKPNAAAANAKKVEITKSAIYTLPELLLAHMGLNADILKDTEISLKDVETRSSQVIVSVAKYICKSSGNEKLLKTTPEETLKNDMMLDLITLYAPLITDAPEKRKKLLWQLDSHLAHNHYLVDNEISLSDFALFCLMNGALIKGEATFFNLNRWLQTFKENVPSSAKFVPETAKQAAEKVAPKTKGVKPPKEEKNVANCPPLKDAVDGKVVTRFPPEPSGHLHIGHCKALMLNQYYAKRYHGKMLLRFDDTNPSKEKQEYEDGIVEDLKSLNMDISAITHTSDYFDLIQDYAFQLIKQGDAYMDDSDVETMRKDRDQGIESKHRTNDVATNLKYFEELLKGSEVGQTFCLRAKMNMQENNKCLRDPVFYRFNPLPHLQTKDKFKAYPTYDLACPIVDSVEGVTHAMRDLNYKDRVPLYNWVLDKLKLRKIILQDFAKMNFVYTIMSKRHLKWFVDEGIATGWDDPRFPTVKGMLRRGVQVEALNEFMVSQGASRKIADIEWDKFWNLNKKKIDPVVPRYMAVDVKSHLIMKINGLPDKKVIKKIAKLPKDVDGQQFGNKDLVLTENIMLETEDVRGNGGVKVGEEILLLQWGVVGVTKVNTDATGEIVSLEGELRPDAKISAPERKIHWLPKEEKLHKGRIYEFDHLISKAVLEPDEDFKSFINKDSWAETEVYVNPEVLEMKPNECLQLLRRGYYRIDKVDDEVHLFTIPDGKAKAMSTFSTATSKMKHH